MNVATVRWTRKRQFVGTDEHGHSVVMDARPEYKGEGSGIRPIELVLHGLAGCTGMDVISVLEKKRQDVRGLEVVVDGVQREDDYPHYYETIRVEYVVKGYGVKPEAVARAIELSEEKYCSVKGMFGPQVKVTSSFRVVEADAPGAEVCGTEG
ncbi:MAG: osmotically inducible protein OsmC [Coriobacteriaceae bacterium]|nr:osmotically inducible protein OsmC [Coriobacteriaceae bacterium]